MLINLHDISIPQVQNILQQAIAPRPIAFASTISGDGQVNLSPFSFFNLFSLHPPIVIFSPSRRVRNGTTKHTLQNVLEVPEVVIHIVTCDMVAQASLASCEYPRGIDEFVKAGFTPVAASRVRPPMVRESPVKLECSVTEVKALGTGPGAGNLVICEVLCVHIADGILNKEGNGIDQEKLHPVARLGGDWYCRVTPDSLFKVAKPNTRLGMGFDQLPQAILHSHILTANQLALLANAECIPEPDEHFNNLAMFFILKQYKNNPEKRSRELHRLAGQLLNNGHADDAWQVLLREAELPNPAGKLREANKV